MAYVKTISVGLNTEKDKDILDYLDIMATKGFKASPLLKLAIREYIANNNSAFNSLESNTYEVKASPIEPSISVKTKDNKFTDFSNKVEVEEVMSSSNKVVKAKDKVNLSTNVKPVKNINFDEIVY